MKKHEVLICARCHRAFHTGIMFQCPHPKVQELYGDAICIYCCKRCIHHESMPLFDGVRCGY